MIHENIMPFEVIDDKYGVVFSENTADMFKETTSTEPVNVKKGYRGRVNWGADNLFPVEVLKKMEKNEVMNSNLFFNIQTGYGNGFEAKRKDGQELDEEVDLKYSKEQLRGLKKYVKDLIDFMVVSHRGD